jgi:hypothetical protein
LNDDVCNKGHEKGLQIAIPHSTRLNRDRPQVEVQPFLAERPCWPMAKM